MSQKLTISAKDKLLDSGIVIRQSQTLSIRETKAGWKVNPSHGNNCGADGMGEMFGKEGYLVPNAEEGCLCAKIGNGSWFRVGKNFRQKLAQEGRLFFAANDDVNKRYGAGYDDNSGEIEVEVELS